MLQKAEAIELGKVAELTLGRRLGNVNDGDFITRIWSSRSEEIAEPQS